MLKRILFGFIKANSLGHVDVTFQSNKKQNKYLFKKMKKNIYVKTQEMLMRALLKCEVPITYHHKCLCFSVNTMGNKE